MMHSVRVLVGLAVLASSVSLGALSQRVGSPLIPRVELALHPYPSPERLSERALVRDGGTEFVLVYIGSPSCGFCNTETTRRGVFVADSVLSDRLSHGQTSYHRMGISAHEDPFGGWGHLRRMLEFDEMIVGRAWTNTGMLRYVWQGHRGPPATPQLLLVRRFVDVPDEEGVGGFEVRDEVVLQRVVGMNEVKQWSEQQLPILISGYLGG